MNNRFKPPTAAVADAALSLIPSWYRTTSLVICFSILSLGLSWLVVPALATAMVQAFNLGDAEAPSSFVLAIDLFFSTLVFIAGCYLAAKLSRGHAFFASACVGVIGSFVYFAEVGGLSGMLKSQYPAWYDFFPDHSIAVIAGWLLTRQHHKT